MLDLLTVAVLAFFGYRLVGGVRAATTGWGREMTLTILHGLRPRHFLRAPVVFAGVVVALIVFLSVPGLDFGWWTAIGGEGNPVTGTSDRTAGTPLEWLVPLVFLTLLIPGLPLFASAEERIFRRGSESRTTLQRIGWAVLFGLVHALVGIPIGAALALSVGGGYFTWAYLRGYRRGGQSAALLESTCSHLAYNLEIVVAVFVGLLTGWV